jgi:hypothetical protein
MAERGAMTGACKKKSEILKKFIMWKIVYQRILKEGSEGCGHVKGGAGIWNKK